MCDKLIAKMEHFTTEYDITDIHIYREKTCASMGFDHRYGKTHHRGPYTGTRWRKEAGVEENGPIEMMMDNEMMTQETVHAIKGKTCVETTSLDEII